MYIIIINKIGLISSDTTDCYFKKKLFPLHFSTSFSQDLFLALMISELSKVILPSHEDRFPEVLRECPTLGVAHLVHPHIGPGELSRHTQPPPAQTGLGAVHHHP